MQWVERIEMNTYVKKGHEITAICTFQVLFKEENTITTSDSGNVDVFVATAAAAVFEVVLCPYASYFV